MRAPGPISPSPASTVAIAASTSSASGTIPASPATVLLSNPISGSVAFFAFGVGSATAAVTGVPVLSGQQLLVDKGAADRVAVILDTGSGSVRVTPVTVSNG